MFTKEQCQKALRQTRGLQYERRLEKINQLLGGLGVEAITGTWQNHEWGNIVALYINNGDSYRTTVLFIPNSQRFVVTSWGDWAERNEKLISN